MATVDLASVSLEADAVSRIPRALAMRHDVLSLSSDGNVLTVAVPDADDRETIESIRFATGMNVEAVRAPREAIRARLHDAYAGGILQPARGGAPAVRALDELHDRALALHASDIHIEPTAEGGVARQRVDGILRPMRSLAPDLYAQLVSRVKLLAGMDIAERRQPQDGRYSVDAATRAVDARVSSMPTLEGEKLVIRLLDRQVRPPVLRDLGFPLRLLDRFTRAVRAPDGFIVVTGPTGSGKTTTLYAALGERDVSSENICTVEDPVEVRMPGIAQVQVNARAGVTFAAALRAFLRQDPNVIMVGEMRDSETAAVAAAASLSGQLVMTTLHSNDAPSAIDRLVELGVGRRTIAAGLSAVVSQRLVRRSCPDCRPPGERRYAGRGCAACDGTGFRGRCGLFEVLFVTDPLREAIARGVTAVTLRRLARELGFLGIEEEALPILQAGETTTAELERVLGGSDAA